VRRRSWRVWALLLSGCVVLGLLLVIAIRPTAILGLSGRALANSLENELNETNAVSDVDIAVDPCSSQGVDQWSCPVELDPGSGPVFFATVESDGRCWTARRARRKGVGRYMADGCVGALDYVPYPAFADSR
jgi:hypothetical protein